MQNVKFFKQVYKTIFMSHFLNGQNKTNIFFVWVKSLSDPGRILFSHLTVPESERGGT
jgi:hypothetical protein